MSHPATMFAMQLRAPGERLRPVTLPVPEPGPGQLLLRVEACAVCRTDLHVMDGDLPHPKLPLIPGHEIVGVVVERGAEVAAFEPGDRVGVPWLGWTCGECAYCRSGRENLCASARFTGYDLDGGYAEYVACDARFCFRIPDAFAPLEAAPLLCAGLIGYRTLRMAGDARRIGIYGFGAAAHLVTQLALHEGRQVFAFTREDDDAARRFARGLGAVWAGASSDAPPDELDAALIFAPAGELVPAALQAVARGGVVVCGGIHMSDIPSFPYRILWGERQLRSVANLTRRDAEEFLAIAPLVPIRVEVQRFLLRDANEALDALRTGHVRGAAVLQATEPAGPYLHARTHVPDGEAGSPPADTPAGDSGPDDGTPGKEPPSMPIAPPAL